ncbi:MAG: tRNA pseudouridine(55) synthase TruB [Cyanobacteria bacterium P01_F01_bin.150]
MDSLEGFLNLYKPAGWTSHDCVAKVRKILRMKRVGHGGTLDPAATGVLPIALGRATRLLQYLPTPKAYRAVIRFGVTTTTDDLEGDRLSETPCPQLTQTEVIKSFNHFLGTIQQIPPKYSAIQVNGKRLYDLARAGVDIDVPIRTVEVHNIELIDWRAGEFPELEVAIFCGPGTYIRAIARDLGARVNVGATLANLIRTESHGFALSDSLTFDQIEELAVSQQFIPVFPHQALNHLDSIVLTAEHEKGWLNGRVMPLADEAVQRLSSPLPEVVTVSSSDYPFLGIGLLRTSDVEQLDSIFLKPKVVFN